MKRGKSTKRNVQKRVNMECMLANIRLIVLDITVRRIRYITKLSRAEKYRVTVMIVRLHRQK